MSRTPIIGLVLLALLPACSSDPATDDSASSTQGIIAGTTKKIAQDGDTPAVGLLVVGGHGYAAALIGPSTVVTACHVVRLSTPSSLRWKDSFGGSYAVKDARCIHNLSPTSVNDSSKYDLAYVTLVGTIDEDVTPLPTTTSLPPEGSQVVFWGTGCDTGGPDEKLPASSIRQKQQFTFHQNPQGDGPKTTMSCAGDSGGPYIWQGRVFAVESDNHHTGHPSTDYDTFARIQPP